MQMLPSININFARWRALMHSNGIRARFGRYWYGRVMKARKGSIIIVQKRRVNGLLLSFWSTNDSKSEKDCCYAAHTTMTIEAKTPPSYWKNGRCPCATTCKPHWFVRNFHMSRPFLNPKVQCWTIFHWPFIDLKILQFLHGVLKGYYIVVSIM